MAKLSINNTDIITESGGDVTYTSGAFASGMTFPAGHITNTLVWKITSGDYTGTGSIWNSANVSFSAVSGTTYEITVYYNARNCASSSSSRRDVVSTLYVQNATHAEGVVATTGTVIANAYLGRYLIGASAGAACSYHYVNLIGFFECGTTRTEYIRVNTNVQTGSEQDIYNYMSATNPAWVVVREYSSLSITAVT
jgi:hypothetical protein